MIFSRNKLKVELNGGVMPFKAHKHDAGFDLAIPSSIELAPFERKTIDLRIRVLIPRGFVGLIFPRSSMTLQGVGVPTGVIDAGYTGHIKLVLVNRSSKTKLFAATERVAQLLIVPVPSFQLVEDSISDCKTVRGTAGFGSSGKFTEA